MSEHKDQEFIDQEFLHTHEHDDTTVAGEGAGHEHAEAGGHLHTHTHEHQDAHEHSHTHGHEHDDTHTHEHSHTHTHGHGHTHTQTRVVLNRLSRAIGHLEAVKRMVENGRDCPEVLIQLAAVESALNNTAKIILKDHIEHCLTEAVEQGDQVALDDLNEAIDRFIK